MVRKEAAIGTSNEVRLYVRNGRTGILLGDAILRARSFRSRAVGLLGRRGLSPGEGLWLEPCPSIHMFFMRFAIDVVFVDRAGVVVRAVPGVRPWRFAFGGRGARSALELPVGTIAASKTTAGDPLVIEEH